MVKPGDNLKIEKINAEKGNFSFDKVLLVADGENLKLGKPFIDGVKIPAEILGQGREKKITILHYKQKTRYHKKAGHRQPFTQIRISNF